MKKALDLDGPHLRAPDRRLRNEGVNMTNDAKAGGTP